MPFDKTRLAVKQIVGPASSVTPKQVVDRPLTNAAKESHPTDRRAAAATVQYSADRGLPPTSPFYLFRFPLQSWSRFVSFRLLLPLFHFPEAITLIRANVQRDAPADAPVSAALFPSGIMPSQSIASKIGGAIVAGTVACVVKATLISDELSSEVLWPPSSKSAPILGSVAAITCATTSGSNSPSMAAR